MFSESDGYERFMGRWSRRLAPLFVTFAGVTEGDRVLDVGSGTGALSAAAAAIDSVQVTGVERSAAYVRYAREHVSGRFEVGDALALPFPADAFNRTLSMLVLNFVADPAAALHQMVRVTRPGGVVAAAVWDYGDGMQMLRTFWDRPSHWIPMPRRATNATCRWLRAGRSRSSGARTDYRMSTSKR